MSTATNHGLWKNRRWMTSNVRPVGRAHFGGEMLDPEVHDKQHQQGGSRNALQIPVDGSSGHLVQYQPFLKLATESTEVTERIDELGVLCDLSGSIYECLNMP